MVVQESTAEVNKTQRDQEALVYITQGAVK